MYNLLFNPIGIFLQGDHDGAPNTTFPGDTCFLDKAGWDTLLRDIHKGQVLPVIGPELVTITLPDGRQVPLYQHLANELAKQLDVSLPLDSTPTLDTVACAWLLSGKESMDICNELRSLLESLRFPPPQALLDLASINDSAFISHPPSIPSCPRRSCKSVRAFYLGTRTALALLTPASRTICKSLGQSHFYTIY